MVTFFIETSVGNICPGIGGAGGAVATDWSRSGRAGRNHAIHDRTVDISRGDLIIGRVSARAIFDDEITGVGGIDAGRRRRCLQISAWFDLLQRLHRRRGRTGRQGEAALGEGCRAETKSGARSKSPARRTRIGQGISFFM